MDNSGNEKGFLERWSRRKTEARENENAPAPAAPRASPAPNPLPELPPIDSLTRDSDYRPFLDSRVSPETQSQALRRLWASDPELAGGDIFEMHGGDFSAAPLQAAATHAVAIAISGGEAEMEKDENGRRTEAASQVAGIDESQGEDVESSHPKE